MTSRRTSKSKPSRAGAKGSQQESVTLSVRLTERQKSLLTEAADIKGWTPANLIRVAALDRAVHILNTNKRTSFKFKRIATTLAEFTFGDPQFYPADPQDRNSIEKAPVDLDFLTTQLGVLWKSPGQELAAELVEAAKLGGNEFLDMFLQAALDVVGTAGILPDPIDPDSLSGD